MKKNKTKWKVSL